MIINIKNKRAIGILKSLEEINFIEISDQDTAQPFETKNHETTKKGDFFDLQGIWKEREINIDTIRNKAWNRE